MPTRKQQSERDDRQRKRVRKRVLENVGEMEQRAFDDALERLRRISADEWNAAREEDQLETQEDKEQADAS